MNIKLINLPNEDDDLLGGVTPSRPPPLRMGENFKSKNEFQKENPPNVKYKFFKLTLSIHLPGQLGKNEGKME